MTGNNMEEKNMFSVLHACFEGLRGLPSFFRMLLSYFIAQITISGLSLFVVPFFSSRILSQNAVTGRFITSALFWFLFAAASVLSDYYGNRLTCARITKSRRSSSDTIFCACLGKSLPPLKNSPWKRLFPVCRMKRR